jgi:hypothetical protein
MEYLYCSLLCVYILYIDNKTGIIYYQCNKFVDDNGQHFVLQSSKDYHYTTVSEEVLKGRFNKK